MTIDVFDVKDSSKFPPSIFYQPYLQGCKVRVWRLSITLRARPYPNTLVNWRLLVKLNLFEMNAKFSRAISL
jgi:hypothetical protein